LKLRTGLPWLADFRDLWTQNTYASYPSLVLKAEQKLESLVINKADRITTINKPMMEALQSKYPDKTYDVISHGFDPQDFADITPTATDRFTITYTGSLYGKRKVDTFLYAIKELVDSGDKLDIRFIGSVSTAQALCYQLNLESVVSFIDTVTHKEVVKYLSSSDVLLLVQSTDSVDKMGTTGKLFEYMASGKPILALASDTVATQIIEQANIGVSVSPNDKEGIKKVVHGLYLKWLSGNLVLNPNEEVIARYDVRKLAKRFGEILDEILS
jgi:glycosyltransferase involved in cell wall biosynthesis